MMNSRGTLESIKSPDDTCQEEIIRYEYILRQLTRSFKAVITKAKIVYVVDRTIEGLWSMGCR